MAQINVGGQRSEEIGSSSGQGQEAQLRIWHCSNCGETGHNASTCQIVVETTEEEDLYSSN